MSYLTVATFDIANGKREDYETVYKEFARIGLRPILTSDHGKTVQLPTTTTAGEFKGQSAAGVREHLCNETQQAFSRNRLRGEIFVSVGGDWTWGHRSP